MLGIPKELQLTSRVQTLCKLYHRSPATPTAESTTVTSSLQPARPTTSKCVWYNPASVRKFQAQPLELQNPPPQSPLTSPASLLQSLPFSSALGTITHTLYYLPHFRPVGRASRLGERNACLYSRPCPALATLSFVMSTIHSINNKTIVCICWAIIVARSCNSTQTTL